jgi:hypothetical protein
MSGEWKGWNTWERYEKAGIVERSLDFSEEDIIVDHAVGRTKNAIGKCWPMDAAVAYSLMKAGPNASLTWSDLVNPFTRAAAVMMTRKVAWGEVPTPGTPSCGHDEFTGYRALLGRPSKDANGYLRFSTGSWNTKTMKQWFNDLKLPDDHPARPLAEVRLSEYSVIFFEHILQTPAFKPLLDLLVERFPDFKVVKDTQVNYALTHYKGECAWANDSEKACLHHDTPKSTMWALVRHADNDGFVTAYTRKACHSGWNNHQWSDRDIKPTSTVSWDEVRRSMAAAVPEHEVIGHIKDSLSRMLKRNDNIVSKEGIGKNAKHKWSDWGWLAEMASYVKNTNSKKRKEGDIVNGWVYTKTRSRQSYGHEIADFVWTPQQEVKDYIVARKEYDDWNARGVLTNMRFASKAQAEAFATAIAAAHLENGGFFAYRTHEDFEKREDEVNVQWSIRSIDQTSSLVMLGTVDPEEYFSPEDIMMLMRNAAPSVIAEHRDKFERLPSYNIKEVKPDGQ